ncbi:GTPase [Streptomyces polyrhachis]|uniref:GTPase n=1 Tax=Streptomyces polyrhachis TaxID=1282885 RepID=A0ABW2GKK9_9ACTN
MWNDGLIARRTSGREDGGAPAARGLRLEEDPWLAGRAWQEPLELTPPAEGEASTPAPRAGEGKGRREERERGEGERRQVSAPLRARLEALRELVGLSRTRLDGHMLAEAGRVLDEAAARQRLSLDHTVVAIAGTTGSGKSALFNALAGCTLAEVGSRRPTTDEAGACAWRGPSDEAPPQLLERLGLPAVVPRPQRDDLGLRGLVLLDLPDFDSAVESHRAEVERLLRRVDAFIWVVDPEKYADAVLHERYLRPYAGYAEVTLVVLNQADRLPGGACEQVLDDLRRLLDEDGLALGEHGEPGAMVLAVSAQTGEGIAELRAELVTLVGERGAPERRLAADLDGAVARLESVYVSEGAAGLSGPAREEFEERLSEAVGARAAGLAAERRWQQEAERAYGSCWGQVWGWYQARQVAAVDAGADPGAALVGSRVAGMIAGMRAEEDAGGSAGERTGGTAAEGAQARGAEGTEGGAGAEGGADGGSAKDGKDGRAAKGDKGAKAAAKAARAEKAAQRRRAGAVARGKTGVCAAGKRASAVAASRPVVEQAVRSVAATAAEGLPAPWAQAVHEAAVRGTEGLAEELETSAGAVGAAHVLERPRWWSVVGATQNALFMLQILCLLWLVCAAVGFAHVSWQMLLGFALVCAGSGPLTATVCRLAARGPARRYGQDTERRLREAAAGCGRARVLEPVAAELLRYKEVRGQYAVAAGGVARV